MDSKPDQGISKTGIWRQTEEDDYLNFCLFTNLNKEMEKKELKDVEFDDKNREKFTLNITKPEHFPDPKKVQRFK